MPKASHVEFSRTFLFLLTAVVSGALAGASAAWTIDAWEIGGSPFAPRTTNTDTGTATSSSSPGITVIPVDRTPQASLVPAPFENRHASAVAGIYRPQARLGNDMLLTDELLLTHAVGVTNDGWFAAPAEALTTVRLEDVVVWYEGATASISRAVVDELSGTIFLKTDLSNVHASAFARTVDVTAGLAAWLERRANRFEPVGIAALREPLQALEGVSSERAARQGVLSGGRTEEGDMGAPVWSANGALVGIVVSDVGEPLRYLPASTWGSALSSLFSTGEIRHASLGVRSVDLAWARLVRTNPDALPVRGALLHEGALGATREPAIMPQSPAAVAGLREGDVIERVDRDILDGSVDLGEVLAEYRPGSRVTLTVRRAGESIEIPVTLGTAVTSNER